MEGFSFLLFFIKATWWFITPLILFVVLKKSWLYWRQKVYYNSLEFILLEIRLPQEVLKTPKAMEYVLVGLHGVWDELKFRDIWIRGETLPWFSLEIAGSGGDVHFYIYTQTKFRDFVEAQIYSQYPDAEIMEAEDYTKMVPPNLPNKDWDVWGTDLMLVKEDAYPLRTYMDFEEQVEERRLDPMASISETLNKLRSGEHIWIQIIIEPDESITKLRSEGEKIVGKMLGRKLEKKKGPAATVAGAVFSQITGGAGEEKKEDPWLQTEWRLSPGEREILKRMEEKTSKVFFDTLMRFVYIGRKDVFSKTNVGAIFGFFRQFNAYNLNSIKPNSKTLPKRSFIYFRNIRSHFRKMRIVWRYKLRLSLPGGITPKYMLNVEELATIFHFPGQIVKAPIMPRVESKKAPAPAGLPVE
jgi:hypothetical protein